MRKPVDAAILRKAKSISRFCQKFWSQKNGLPETRYAWDNLSENNREMCIALAKRFMK